MIGGIKFLAWAASVAVAGLAIAGDEIIDGKEYWRNPGGNLHQYLYFNSFSSDTGWPNFRSTREVQDPPETLSWSSDAVLVFEKDTYYSGVLNISEIVSF